MAAVVWVVREGPWHGGIQKKGILGRRNTFGKGCEAETHSLDRSTEKARGARAQWVGRDVVA